MKSGSGSAVAFGCLLRAVRRRLAKNQSDVAGSFSPKLSVAAVSMAEGGNRPPKTEEIVRGYAAALELDEDALVELWWAMQGLVELEDGSEERTVHRWWQQLGAWPQAEIDYHQAVAKASKEWTPNEETYAPSLRVFALADAICDILIRLLGESWHVRYRAETGLRDIVDGRLAAVMIELRPAAGDGASQRSGELLATFACPEPLARPVAPEQTGRSNAAELPPDVAWILEAVEALPAKQRAAVAGFIHGIRQGASVFSDAPRPE